MSVSIKLGSLEDKKRLLKRTLIVLNNGEKVQFALPTNDEFIFKIPYYISGVKNLSCTPMKSFPNFSGTLKNEQNIIFENAKLNLLNDGVVMISCYTGFGKTVTTLALACFLKLKTLIVVHRTCLLDQWSQSIKKFCSDENVVQLPTTTTTTEGSNFFSIINIASIPKVLDLSQYQLLITDETHLLLSEKRSLNLLKISPKKMIGLTATPYRPDELNLAFKLFFGSNYILRKLHKLHYIYEVKTNTKIEDKRLYNGMLDWNHVLKQQSENEERNSLIVKIIKSFESSRTWLILVKRKTQAKILETLLEKNFIVTTLIGSEREYNKNAQILIGTVGKIGTGFDHPKLDSLLLGADMVEFYIQFLGRVMRTEKDPIIIDLIDDHPILKMHYSKRKKIYMEHGGQIKKTF